MKHPRVLHLGIRPIGAPTNSGLTLGSLFGDWPDDALLQLCGRRYEPDPDHNVILTPPSVAPVDGLVRAVMGRSLRPGVTDGLNNAVGRRGHRVPIRLRARLAASVVNDIGPVHLPRDLLRRIDEFQPEVIHTLLGGVRAMRLATALAKRLDLPVVPHFMDDWMETLFDDGQLLGFARRIVVRCRDEVLEYTPRTLAIGEDMAREYERTLGRPSVVVGNSVHLDDFRVLNVSRSTPDEPLRMRYVGGLHLGRPDVVHTIAMALDGRTSHGRAWVLELFVPPADIEIARGLERNLVSVRYGGTLSPNQVAQTLVDADALAFVESPLANISRFTRLSVSTKVPQYLASGRPVLVVGPEDQGSVKTLVRSGAAHFAGDGHDRVALDRALSGVEDSQLMSMQGLSPETAAWIQERFGLEPSRERLRLALMESAWGST